MFIFLYNQSLSTRATQRGVGPQLFQTAKLQLCPEITPLGHNIFCPDPHFSPKFAHATTKPSVAKGSPLDHTKHIVAGII